MIMIYRFIILLSILLCFGCDQGVEQPDNITEDATPVVQEISTPDSGEGRAAWQKPKLVIDMLGDLSDKVVADLGAGTGYFAFRLAFKADKVIALDIDPKMISLMEDLEQKLPLQYQDRFEARLASIDDSKLEDAEVDMILIINTIAYIDNRVEYLSKLRNKLKDDGQVIIMDFKMKRISEINAPPKTDRVYVDQLEEELSKAGYSNVTTDDQMLKYQYITIGNNSMPEVKQ